MKTSFAFCLLFGLSLVFASPLVQAQSRPRQAVLPGTWTVETNLTTRDHTIVRFYDGQDRLVYEEYLTDFCLDLSQATRLCRRTKKQLHGALQQVLRTPPTPTHSSTLLAQQFGQSRRVQREYAVR